MYEIMKCGRQTYSYCLCNVELRNDASHIQPANYLNWQFASVMTYNSVIYEWQFVVLNHQAYFVGIYAVLSAYDNRPVGRQLLFNQWCSIYLLPALLQLLHKTLTALFKQSCQLTTNGAKCS